MVERTLRGSRLGTVSYESEEHTAEFAARQSARYTCPRGHGFTVPFAAAAVPPAVWECRVCGSAAELNDGLPAPPPRSKPVRTHWDMLRERRSTEDLEEVLAERLAVLRETRRSA